MAIEQSINCDCGAVGGLPGVKPNRAAMERWFSTSHLKEATTRWVGKDESVVNETCEVTE